MKLAAQAINPTVVVEKSWAAVFAELVAAADLTEKEPIAAIQHVVAARLLAKELHSVARDRREVVLADAVQVCIDDLQRVIDLRLR